MPSLFTRLQSSYFDASYGGRFVEHLIQELSIEEPTIINELFRNQIKFNPKEDEFIVEYEYKQNRIADIAIISKSTQYVKGIVEIKYDDHNKSDNYDQLKDYLKFCKKNEIPFIYLTQYYPPIQDLNLLNQYQKSSHLLYSTFGELLLKKKNPIILLLVNYFKDKGYMFTTIDEKTLWKLLVRFFNPWGGQGRIRAKDDIIEGIPATFGNVINNMNIISIDINSNLKEFFKKPSIDFYLEPFVEKRRIEKLIKESTKKASLSIPTNCKGGGCLTVYLSCPISNTNLYFEYGFYFKILPKQKKFKTYIYSSITQKGFYMLTPEEKQISNKKLSVKDKEYLIREFRIIIYKTLNQAIKEKELKSYSKILNSMIVALKN